MKKIEILSLAANGRHAEKSSNWNFGWSSRQVDAAIKSRRLSVDHSARNSGNESGSFLSKIPSGR
ncbi:hypothetical protein ACO0K0_07675 [Undibacterium sp. SXout11W]|uniref:hypothetical protein n=1 Tax=Undibacterium TaxID=401469 RepID=UPI003BF1DB51